MNDIPIFELANHGCCYFPQASVRYWLGQGYNLHENYHSGQRVRSNRISREREQERKNRSSNFAVNLAYEPDCQDTPLAMTP